MQRNRILVFWARWAVSYSLLRLRPLDLRGFRVTEVREAELSKLSFRCRPEHVSWCRAKTSGWFDKRLITLSHSLEDKVPASDQSIQGEKGGHKRKLF